MRAFTKNSIMLAPDLGLPAFETVRNKDLLFKPSLLCYSVIAVRTKKRERKCKLKGPGEGEIKILWYVNRKTNETREGASQNF